ncbi:unnamed protein product [Leptidea sinapis]|uniref:TauD/TfdA-like domain-containing protein n=1 Tax=Leptidea sinapis TaxID=189913 RepID=A0A5E4QP51_9NEOP|nr:unnamed protein product [Leptidea sinapis]
MSVLKIFKICKHESQLHVTPTIEATEVVCNALGGVMHTNMYGGMWTISTNLTEHSDTAYTNLALKQHTDNSYFSEPAGLQIFHCIEHNDGTGGESIFMDGFYGAKKLKEEHPKDFEFLSNFQLDAEYIEDGHHFRLLAPVLKVNKFGDVVHLRTPMAFADGEECRSYYRSLKNLAQYFEDPQNQFVIKLQPGTVVAIDNFRVLHGRAAFTGKRILCGSYVRRDDWTDKARVLKLIK